MRMLCYNDSEVDFLACRNKKIISNKMILHFTWSSYIHWVSIGDNSSWPQWDFSKSILTSSMSFFSLLSSGLMASAACKSANPGFNMPNLQSAAPLRAWHLARESWFNRTFGIMRSIACNYSKSAAFKFTQSSWGTAQKKTQITVEESSITLCKFPTA